MSSIDNRIVNMQFNNREFEKNAGTTLTTLAELRQGLKLDGIASGVENVSSKFNAFGAIAFSVLNNITTAALQTGQQLIASVLEPLIEGGQRRALNIEQAKFQLRGLGLDVERVFGLARDAVLGTAFGLDEAAKAAANLGASQVTLEQMGIALKGIAGVAALSGSSFADIADVFQTVAGQGRLMGNDLNRLASRGVNAAATLAKAFGVTELEIRDMVSKGQISFEMFATAMDDAFGEHATKANETYTGSLANMRAALSRIGAAFATSNFEQQRRIFNALTPVIDGLAKALKPLMDLFNENTLDGAKNWEKFLSAFAVKNADGIVEYKGILLDLINAMGPFIDGVRYLGKIVSRVFNIIGQAFKTVFPAGEGGPITVLTDLAKAFRNFAKSITVSSETAKVIKNVFTGLFLVLRVVFSAVWGVVQIGWTAVTMFGSLVAALFKLIEPIGKFLKSLFPIQEGAQGASDAIGGFFEKVVEFLNILNGGFLAGLDAAAKGFDEWLNSGGPQNAIIDLINGVVFLGKAIAEMWTVLTSGNLTEGSIFDENSGFIRGLKAMHNLLKPIITMFTNIGQAVGEFLTAIGDGIKFGFENINWGLVFGGMFAGAGGVLIYEGARLLRLTYAQFGGIIRGLTGTFNLIERAYGDVSGVLVAMQQQIKADALMKIALALLVLAAAMALISLVDTDRMIVAISALGLGMLGLVETMAKMTALSVGGYVKLPLLVATMTGIAGAMLLMAGAIVLLGQIPAEKAISGTVTMIAMVGTMVGAAVLMSKYVSGITAASGAMLIMAAALNLLVLPIIALGKLKLETLVQGTVALVGVLAAVVGVSILLSNKALQTNMFSASLALLAMSKALQSLIIPIVALAFIPFGNLVQGMLAVSIMLGVLIGWSLLLNKAEKQIAVAALALLAIGAALNLLIVPILALAFIPFPNLMQGLLGVALALGILGGIALLLGLAGPALLIGAGGILMIGLAMWLLVPPILALSMLDFGTLIGTLSGLGLALIILSLLALVAAPGLLLIAPALIIFAAALIVIAVAFALFTASVLILTPALAMFGLALQEFAEQLPAILQYLPVFAQLGIALGFLGAGAIVAGIGLTLLGIGIAALGAGLWVIDQIAGSGGMALASLVDLIVGMILKAPGILIVSAALLVLAASILVLGAGLMIVGVGMLLFASAMAILMLVGGAGAAALGFLFTTLLSFIEKVPELLLMAAAILLLGVGVLVLGAGLIVLGVGAAIATGGLALLQLVAYSGGMALMFLAQAVIASTGAIPGLFGLGAGFLLLGAGLTIFAIGAGLSALALLMLVPGILLLGLGVSMLAKSLVLLSIVGSAGTKALGKFIESMDGLVFQVPAILAIGAAFVVLGGGMLLVGAGLLLLGAGSILAAVGLMMMMSVSNRVNATFSGLLATIQAFMPAVDQMSLIGRITLALAESLKQLTTSSESLANGINRTKDSMFGLKTEATGVKTQMSGLFSSVSAQLPAFKNSLTTASSSYREFVNQSKSLSSELERSLKSYGTKNEAAAKELVDKMTKALIAGLVASTSVLKARGKTVGENIILGIASGLQNRSNYLNQIARQVALDALQSSKDALGINSPSKEYEKVGEDSDKGLALGLLKYSKLSEDAADEVGKRSVAALTKTLSGMTNLISERIDTAPTIRPVLDLSAIKKDAATISRALSVKPIEVDGSYNQAASISASNRVREQEAQAALESGEGDTNLTFIQNNTSPKAIDPAETYRRTKNQISMAKDKLGAT